MNKIEAGARNPGIKTYQRIMDVLGADIIVRSKDETVKEKCIKKSQKILLKSTEKQAVFLTNMLESMWDHLETL